VDHNGVDVALQRIDLAELLGVDISFQQPLSARARGGCGC
jgi:hypothetical protein